MAVRTNVLRTNDFVTKFCVPLINGGIPWIEVSQRRGSTVFEDKFGHFYLGAFLIVAYGRYSFKALPLYDVNFFFHIKAKLCKAYKSEHVEDIATARQKLVISSIALFFLT